MMRYNKNKTLYLLVLSFMMLVPSILRAQTPGGTGLTTEVWLSADKVNGTGGVLPADGASVDTWSSVLSGGRSYVKNANSNVNYNLTPIFKKTGSNLMNFQPHLNFTANGTKLINGSELLDLTKAYYVFHVSRTASKAAYRVLFAFSTNNGAQRNNNIGWYTGNPYFQIDGSRRYHQGNGKLYGVNAVIIPNSSGSGAKAPNAYMNGIVNSSALAARELATSSYNMSVIGNADYEDDYPFTGDVQELIVISADKGSTIDTNDLAKINTYLAIKYGITLEAGDYMSGSDAVVWERGRTGYTDFNKNIFGLANDEASGLLQKQAKSTDGKELTIFVGDELADLNTNNTSNALSDGDYLLLGSNANKHLIPYKYGAGTGFDGGTTLDEEVNYRRELTFRAQATRSFTDIKIAADAMYVLVSTDPDFAPGSTRVYKVDDTKGYASVNINDGDYISFAIYEGLPGGLHDGLELWLSADYLLGKSGDMPESDVDITQWTDLSVNGRNFTQVSAGSQVPKYNYNGMNFNPSVNFYVAGENLAATDAQRKLISESFPTDASKSYYTFWVSEVDTENAGATGATVPAGATRSVVFTTNLTRDIDNNGWYIVRSSTDSPTPRLMTSTYGTFTQDFPVNADKASASISGIIRTNSTNAFQTQYFNGESNSVAGRAMNNGSSTAVIGGALATATGTTHSFFGDVQEIIVYSGTAEQSIDPIDLEKIQSYLAIKYGICMEGKNLVNSSGDIVWDGAGSKNDNFKKNVFGLGHDKVSGLYVKQSKNSEASEFTAYVGDALATLNVDNTGIIPNGQYIIFGSNGGGDFISYPHNDKTSFQEGAIEDKVNNRSGTTLKVQLTGTTEFTVNLISKGEYLMVSDTPDFIPAQTKLYKLADDGSVSVTLKDGEYISNCFFASGPGGVVDGLRMWLDAGEKDEINYNEETGDIISWADKSNISNTVYSYMKLMNGVRVWNQPPGFAQATRRMNYYPSVEFRNRPAQTGFDDNYGDYLSTMNAPGSVVRPKEFTTIHVIFQDFASADRNYFMAFGWLGPAGAGLPEGQSIRSNGFGKPGFGLNYTSRYGVVGRLFEANGTGGVEGVKSLSNVGATSININTIDVPGLNVRFESNGIYEDRYIGMGGPGEHVTRNLGVGFKMNGHGTLGGGSLREASMIGYMAEAIYFEKKLSQANIDKIYSSMAMKYGITLRFEGRPEGSNFDYKLSNGTSIWNGNLAGSNYEKYYNNVAGLVRDDGAEFFNNISNSTDAQSVVTMMVQGRDMLVGQGEESDLKGKDLDNAFLFWGNNGVNQLTDFTEEQQREFCTMVQQKTGRIWMVRKSDNMDKFKVTMVIKNDANGNLQNAPEGLRLEGFSNIEQAGKRVHLLVADSPEKLENNQWDMAIPSTYVKYKGQMLNYTFTDEFTYFALGLEDVPGAGCDNCNFEDIQGVTFDKNFQKSTWPNRTTEKTFNVGVDYDELGDAFAFDATIKTEFVNRTTGAVDNTARFASSSPRLYQNSRKGNILFLNRYRSTTPIMRTTIEMTSAASAKFQIRGINRQGARYETITISGFCEGETDASVFPQIKGVNPNSSQRTFTILGNEIKSKYRPYTNSRFDTRDRNVVDVTFSGAVKKIQIDQQLTGTARTGSNWLGIGDISYYCPAPLPEFNEIGLAMRMTVFPKTVIMCGSVNPVRYEIDIFNSNCDDKPINLTDTLPENMYWDIAEIKIDENSIREKTKIQILDKDAVGDKRILQIDSLYVPGTPSTSLPFTFTLGAFFKAGAPGGTYENQAWFNGSIYKNGAYVETEPYPSADFILGAGRKTPVEALDGGMDLQPVAVSVSDAGCYTPEKIIPLTFKIKNPNAEVVDSLIAEIYYNEEFTYVANSMKINGTSIAPKFEKDEDTNQDIPGYFYITYLDNKTLMSLAANGEMAITFNVKAPEKAGLEYDMDEAGNYLDWDGNTSITPFSDGQQAIMDMELEFSINTDMIHPCISASFDNAYIDKVIPYCQSKECIITNRMLQPRLK